MADRLLMDKVGDMASYDESLVLKPQKWSE